ncbi:B-glycosyltransferase [Desmospora sp. 8437]|nr:B-glycosyltransferase [Desmospora sp. 8437]
MARWIRGKVSELNATDVASGWGIQNYPNQLHLPSQSLFPM